MRRILLIAYFALLPLVASGAEPRRLPAGMKARPMATQAEGTLRRNTEADPDSPAYVLLDDQGRVACLVQPQPGVKLAQYVGRRLRLSGARAPLPGQKSDLLTAQSVESAVRDRATFAAQVAAHLDSEGEEPDAEAAAHQEILPTPMNLEGETYYEGPDEGAIVSEGVVGAPYLDSCDSCNDWGCGDCCRRGLFSGVYVRGEYLHWWTDGLFAPALVTTSRAGTIRENAGVLGIRTTSILFGDEGLNSDGRPGFRISGGKWFDAGRCHAIEGDFWWLSEGDDNFFQSSPGSPILARPYYDLLGGTESAQLVAFPDVLAGSVRVDTYTELMGAGLRKRWNVCGCEPCDPCDPCARSWRYDVTAGYRFMQLRDGIAVTEDLTSLDTTNPGSFLVFDQFQTENTFHGGEVGTVWQGRCRRWSWEFLGRIAVGNTRSRVEINGFTDIIPTTGASTRSTGGLLAQRTNIGEYERDALAVVPELGATVGFQLTRVWRVTAGYTFIYWSNVVRAGQQIDRDINENLLPPEVDPFTGPERPRFVFNDTDFWAHGINVGLDARW